MTTFKIESFKDQYRLALIFSMIEGLNAGKTIAVESKEDPQPLADLIVSSEIPSLQITKQQSGPQDWTLKIEKIIDINASEVGCCGMCGGGDLKSKA